MNKKNKIKNAGIIYDFEGDKIFFMIEGNKTFYTAKGVKCINATYDNLLIENLNINELTDVEAYQGLKQMNTLEDFLNQL